jgi:hypothetical protein
VAVGAAVRVVLPLRADEVGDLGVNEFAHHVQAEIAAEGASRP